MKTITARFIRRLGVFLCLSLLINMPSLGQWTYNGSSIYYNGGSVGINTTNPVQKLHVAGNLLLTGAFYRPDNAGVALSLGNGINKHYGNHEFRNTFGSEIRVKITDAGSVGIGTSAPAALLDVRGESRLETMLSFHTSGTHFKVYEDTDTPGWVRFRPYTGSGFMFSDNGDAAILAIRETGSVGIGTTTPDHMLDVNGTARAKEVIVETTGADFVFADDYRLRSLDEVERYIEEQGHLPEIPSAQEMQTDGMRMGEMQTKLLQKIEELTLYIIAQQKEIETLKAQQND